MSTPPEHSRFLEESSKLFYRICLSRKIYHKRKNYWFCLWNLTSNLEGEANLQNAKNSTWNQKIYDGYDEYHR